MAAHSLWVDLRRRPRALAGRLRREQTFPRGLGIDITFSREGRAGNGIIRYIKLWTIPSGTVRDLAVRGTSASNGPVTSANIIVR